jgi:pimeloyl-ACP methyl ester carboxylesterase
VKETVLRLDGDGERVGILTHPEGKGEERPLPATTAPASRPPVVMLLDAGLLHHVGPNRFHVKLARALAAQGLFVLRFDFSGIGDAPPRKDALPFDALALEETVGAMDALEKRLGVRRFVPFGICSGGDVALRVALKDTRVAGAVVVNGTFGGLVPKASRGALERDADFATRFRYYRKKIGDKRSLVRFLTFKTNYMMLFLTLSRVLSRTLFGRKPSPLPVAAAKPASGRSPMAGDFKLLAAFSEGSTSLDMMRLSFGKEWSEISRRFPAIAVRVFENTDHVFTPLDAQAKLVSAVREWLQSMP